MDTPREKEYLKTFKKKKGSMEKLTSFYKNRKVFVTGHTGFKGSWLVSALLSFGAKVYGYSI